MILIWDSLPPSIQHIHSLKSHTRPPLKQIDSIQHIDSSFPSKQICRGSIPSAQTGSSVCWFLLRSRPRQHARPDGGGALLVHAAEVGPRMPCGRAVQLGLVWKGGLQERCGAAPRPLGDRQHRWYLLPRVQPVVPKKRAAEQGIGQDAQQRHLCGLQRRGGS